MRLRRAPEAAALLGLAATNILVLSNMGGPRAAIGLPVALVLPGALALRALGVKRRGWEWLLHAVALSLAGLMLVALPLALIGGRALSATACMLTLDALILLLVALAAVRSRHLAPTEPLTVRPARTFMAHAGLGVVGLSGVALAVAGAQRLNAGGGPELTAGGLVLAVGALMLAALAARRGHITAAGLGIYLGALAVLLATSLRGVGVTGHDIKVEHRVLADVLVPGRWRTGGAFSGYNSCLSLTVLPAFLSRLLGLAALDVYRVCFQVVFALVPVGAFGLARRLLPAGPAALAATLFVVFPTFVNDMPTLNRQEMALVFLTVAALTLLRAAGRGRTALLVVCGAGMTVSHYTTTYVTIALLLLAWLVRHLGRRLVPRGPEPGLALPALVLCAMAVAWAFAAGSAPAFAGNLGGAAESVIAAQRLGAPGREATDAELLEQYMLFLRSSGPSAEAFAPAPGCMPRTVPQERIPPTTVGAALDRSGIPPGAFNAKLRLLATLVFQGGAVLGVLLLWWRLRKSRRPGAAPRVLAEVSVAGAVLLAAMVVAPQLSNSYGPLRLYQQVLILFGPLIVLAFRKAAWPAALTVALTTVGLVPQATGGYAPQLNLNNAGSYYRAEYATASDVATMAWVRRELEPHTWVVSDGRGTANLRAMTAQFPEEGIAPGAVPPSAYLVLPDVEADRVTAVVLAGDRVLRYRFPLACVDSGRELLHANGPSRVYGPAVRP